MCHSEVKIVAKEFFFGAGSVVLRLNIGSSGRGTLYALDWRGLINGDSIVLRYVGQHIVLWKPLRVEIRNVRSTVARIQTYRS